MWASSPAKLRDDATYFRMSHWISWTARLLTGAVALLLLRFAAGMDQEWTERHLLPDILVPSDWLVRIVQIERR
jgi:hypothetical protein